MRRVGIAVIATIAISACREWLRQAKTAKDARALAAPPAPTDKPRPTFRAQTHRPSGRS